MWGLELRIQGLGFRALSLGELYHAGTYALGLKGLGCRTLGLLVF